MHPDLSIIIPVFNEEDSVAELSKWIRDALSASGLSYEVIFIDDGSTDDTWKRIVEVGNQYPGYKGLRFNRNFGKSAALQTGFKAAKGEVVITMDGDLQDNPEEIPALVAMIREEKYHLVSGWKKKRNDPASKRIPSKLFNYVTRILSGIKLHDFNCGLKAYQSTVVKNISVYGEMHRYIPVIAKWAGFNRIGEKVVIHHPRKYGKTKFGIERFIKGFLDLLSVTFVSRFRRNPMHLFGTAGLIVFLAGFILTVMMIWEKLNSVFITHVPLKRELTDQPIFYFALVCLIIGVQLFLTGFLSELIAMQSHTHRDYLVIERSGFESSEGVPTYGR